MSVRLRLVLAALFLLVGTISALLATDVVRWHSRMQSGDARFAAGSSRSGLWAVDQPFLFGTAKALLGLDDDLAFRAAVRNFALGRPRDEPFSDTGLISQRGRAQEQLAALVSSGQDPSRRAAAANLIGVLGFANATIDPSQAPSYLVAAIGRFRQALALDPNNADAKYNLELALGRLPAARAAAGQTSPPTSSAGVGTGAGAGAPGSGY